MDRFTLFPANTLFGEGDPHETYPKLRAAFCRSR